MNSEENHIVEGNSPTEQQARSNAHPQKNKFILSRMFGGFKQFIDKAKTDAVKSEPPPVTRYESR